MTTYWVLFSLPAVFYLIGDRLNVSVNRVFWFTTAALFTFFIGLRHEVGCDWYGYYSTYEAISSYTYSEIFNPANIYRGVAFYALTQIIGQTSLGFYGFNVLCGIFFCWALFSFCRRQTSPWLACLIAVPYLLIVISMGYVRQSIAISFLFFALTQLEEKRHWRYSALILSGSLFHSSLALLFPLILIPLYKKNHSMFLFALLFIGLASIYMFINYIEFWRIYFSSETSKYASSGALPRALMNAIPAVFLLLIYRRHRLIIRHPVWLIFAVLSVLSVLVAQTESSGFDRLALYLIPIQLYAWPRIIKALVVPRFEKLVGFLIILVYAGYQYIWLNFSDHAVCWVPYISIVF